MKHKLVKATSKGKLIAAKGTAITVLEWEGS